MLDNKVKFEDLSSLKNSFERVTKVLKDNPDNEAHLKEFYSYYLSVFEPNHYYNQVYKLSTFNFNSYFKIFDGIYSDDEKFELKLKYFDELYSIYKNFKKFAKEHLKNDLVICKREYDYNYIRYLLNDLSLDELELLGDTYFQYSYYSQFFSVFNLDFDIAKCKKFLDFSFSEFEIFLISISKKDYSKNNIVEEYKEYYKKIIVSFGCCPVNSRSMFELLVKDLELLEYSFSSNSFLLPNYENLHFLKHYQYFKLSIRNLLFQFERYSNSRIEHLIYFLEQVKKDFNLI